MAFQKNLTFRGLSGSYVNIFSHRVESGRKEAAACLALWVDLAHRNTAGAQPIGDRCIKVLLTGADFETWLSAEALQAAFEEAPTFDPVKSQFYKAAKAGVGVVSDWGHLVLADATEV